MQAVFDYDILAYSENLGQVQQGRATCFLGSNGAEIQTPVSWMESQIFMTLNDFSYPEKDGRNMAGCPMGVAMPFSLEAAVTVVFQQQRGPRVGVPFAP